MKRDSEPKLQTSEPLTFEEQTRQRLWLIVLAGLALIALILVARPAYRQFKQWRARALAAQAESALARNDLTNAVRTAQAAYLMRPSEPAAIRAAARVQARAGSPNALDFWQALIASGGAKAEDRRSFVEAAIALGAFDRAGAELQNLVHLAPDDARNLFLLARLALAQGKHQETLEFARQALQRESGSKQYQLFLATLEYPDSPARAKLLQLAQDRTAFGLEAATFLARQADLNSGDAAEIAALLEKHPLANTAHYLLGVSLRIQLEPQLKARLIEAAGTKCSAGGDDPLATFGSWLNDQREFTATLQWIPIDRAGRNRELLLHRLDALGGLDLWDEIQTILGNPELPLPEAFREAFRARSATKAGDDPLAASAWKNALQAASGNPEELYFLAQYAEKCGDYQQAKRAYRALTSGQAHALPIYLAWSQLVHRHGTTEELREVLNEMANRWPEQESFRNDSAYLDLLLHRNMNEALRTAAALVEKDPVNLPFRSTLALAQLRLNQPAEALAALTERAWDWDQALPTSRMIYAAVLSANGKSKEAAVIARSIPKDALRPEERQMISPILEP